MGLSEGEILQINATIIAGILILLTIGSINLESNPLFLRMIGSMYVATALVILPFAASAIIAIGTIMFNNSKPDLEKLINLRTSKIEYLKQKIENETDEKMRKKLMKKMKKTQEKLDGDNKNINKLDDEKEFEWYRGWRNKSLITMAIGFIYLSLVIVLLAASLGIRPPIGA